MTRVPLRFGGTGELAFPPPHTSGPTPARRRSLGDRLRSLAPFADVRHGLRILRARPGVTAVAVLSLALGLGLNVAIFSIASSLLLEPLPVRDPHRIVSIYTSDFSGPAYGANAYVDLQDFAERNTALEGIAATTIQPLNLGTRGDTARVFAEIVSPEYFSVLGVSAHAGRVFDRTDAGVPGNASVAVIGYRLWQRQFGGDTGLIGRTITLNDAPFTVVGIAPLTFPGMQRGLATDLWLPITAEPQFSPGTNRLTSRGSRSFFAFARLRPDATIENARAQFRAIAAELRATHREHWSDLQKRTRRITVLDERESRLGPDFAGPVLGFLGLLLGLMFLVLLVACANVASLLLARASARRREMAIRVSLGAGRLRLVRQLFTESLLLAALSGAAALLVATWTMTAIERFRPPVQVPILLNLSLDARVLTFAAGLSLLTSLIFGLAPALQGARPDVLPALKGDDRIVGRRRLPTLRGTLVVLQVAGSLALLVVATLFVRALQHAHDIPLGFNPEPVLTMAMDLGARPTAQTQQIYAEVLERVGSLPGVQSATLAQTMPLGIDTGRRHMTPEGYQAVPGEEMETSYDMIGPRYFETLGIPLKAGREFTPADREKAPPVIIVNEAYVARYWPGQSALGKGVSVEGPKGPYHAVVGIVANAKFVGLGQDAVPMMYLPLAQFGANDAILMLKTAANPSALAPIAGRELRAIDRTLSVFDVQPMREAIGITLLPHRFAATLLGAAGVLGVALAAIGLFGILAQLVTQRTREIGIRIALGAEQGDVLRLIVWHGLRLTLAGLVLGLGLAAACSRLASGFIFGVSPSDPLTFVSVPLTLLAVACLASYLPARRAARIAPTDALRYD